ncbi:DUF3311 domain-containing protein [Brevibacillus nitrificans]|uniref:DUF3311 domain-containing protein n=1 Tax=Brevibacillus nitrificans TaxID=651560 RepID=UPI002629B3B2|nr:DUF3311 domain-containing protein [Brevibacillus nitrificans]MED1793360.1 DUF3311 domain-containing protein [Brevibacillus nitrificans]
MKAYYLLGVLPFLAILVGTGFVNKVEPYVFGLPFLMFWFFFWTVMTAVIMGIIYKLDPINKQEEETE